MLLTIIAQRGECTMPGCRNGQIHNPPVGYIRCPQCAAATANSR